MCPVGGREPEQQIAGLVAQLVGGGGAGGGGAVFLVSRGFEVFTVSPDSRCDLPPLSCESRTASLCASPGQLPGPYRSSPGGWPRRHLPVGQVPGAALGVGEVTWHPSFPLSGRPAAALRSWWPLAVVAGGGSISAQAAQPGCPQERDRVSPGGGPCSPGAHQNGGAAVCLPRKLNTAAWALCRC